MQDEVLDIFLNNSDPGLVRDLVAAAAAAAVEEVDELPRVMTTRAEAEQFSVNGAIQAGELRRRDYITHDIKRKRIRATAKGTWWRTGSPRCSGHDEPWRSRLRRTSQLSLMELPQLYVSLQQVSEVVFS